MDSYNVTVQRAHVYIYVYLWALVKLSPLNLIELECIRVGFGCVLLGWVSMDQTNLTYGWLELIVVVKQGLRAIGAFIVFWPKK